MFKEYPMMYSTNNKKAYKATVTASLNALGIVWAILSVIGMGLSCVGFYLPYWLEGSMQDKTPVYLGTFRRCNYPKLSEDGQIVTIQECGRYTTFLDIPSLWWQIGAVVIGVGCGLSVLVAFTALLSCCIDDVMTKSIARIGGVIQLFAGCLIGGGCALYPYGWDSKEVQSICGGTSGPYQLGTCSMAWAYYVTISGGGLLLMCSLLSCNATKLKSSTYQL